MALQPNDSIGPYLLLRPLGKGAFGEVWLARHHDLAVERALKVPTDPNCLSQLRNEGKIQFQLNHPNIVRTLELNTFHDPPYYVMEYVAGDTLRQRLRDIGKMPLAEALPILRQILLALEHAHSQGVLHRDLKPENVLLQADGTAKVADFGFGKVQAAAAQSILLSGSIIGANGSSIVGTIDYMSPQQRAPEAGDSGDPRDDLYAVGVIACELLTGSRPKATGVANMLQRAGADSALGPILLKALEEERSDRYANAPEMLGELERGAAATSPADVSLPPKPQGPPPPGVRLGSPDLLSVSPPPKPPGRPPLPPALSAKRAGDIWTNTLGMKFAYVPAGEFVMGSPANEAGRSDDETEHKVRLTAGFLMAATTVTQAQWKAIVGTDPSHFKGKELPVEQASWDDASDFCRRLSEKEGKRYRLPTEAEWEYACRAGTTAAYGGTGRLEDMGWYHGNSGTQTHPVAQLKPNAWGLYDMHGNVWEWCSDGYADYGEDAIDPQCGLRPQPNLNHRRDAEDAEDHKHVTHSGLLNKDVARSGKVEFTTKPSTERTTS